MNTTQRNLLYGFAGLLAAATMWSPASGQVVNDALWTPAGVGNWNGNANWSVGGVPSATFNEIAVINNDGTAFLNAAASFTVGGVAIGRADGLGGTLEIRSGGSLTAIDNGVTDGRVIVGQGAQDGRLLIDRGGTLNSVSLETFPATNSEVVLGGGAGGGVATLSPDFAFLRTRTQLIGPNVAFSTGNLGMDNSSVLSYEVTAGGVSTIDVAGPTLLAGTVELTFDGVSPAIGNSWTLIDSEALISNINGVSTPDTLPAGSVLASQKGAGGTNGSVLSVSVEETITLQINRGSGQAQLLNQSGLTVGLGGYQIVSPGGSLSTSWNSLADQTIGSFQEASPTINLLSEISSGAATNVTPTGFSLGEVYTPVTPAFGTGLDENISFSVQRSDGRTLDGVVEFVGESFENTLVLTIDPSNGNARITNDSPTPVGIDVYSVASDSSALQTTWNSLSDQGIGAWDEANPSADRLSELEPTGQLNLASNGFVELDGLWSTSGTQDPADLEFIFRAIGLGEFEGVVEFESIVGGPDGDYNNDGVVDIADYTTWRDFLGTDFVLANDPTPGVVDQSDYTTWVNNFGMTASSSAVAVPEPSSLAAIVAAIASGLLGRIRRRRYAPAAATPRSAIQPRSLIMGSAKIAAFVGCLAITVSGQAQPVTITGADIDASGLSQPFDDGSITLSPFSGGGTPGTFSATTPNGFIGVSGGNNDNAVDDIDGDPATTNDRERFDIALASGFGLSEIAWSFSRAYPIRITGFAADPQAFFSATGDAGDLLHFDSTAGELSIYQRQFSGAITSVGFLNTSASENQTLSVTVDDLITAGPQVAFSSFTYDTASGAVTAGDVDGNGTVDLVDFGIIRDNFGVGTLPSEGDLTRDGEVDLADYGVWEANFGGSSFGLVELLTVPEPGSFVLLAAGAALVRRRR